MAKYYGARCSQIIQGQCVTGWPGWACECDGTNCSEYGVGDMEIEGLTDEDLHKKLYDSTTKFVFDKEGVLIEVGMLANAGARQGDKLIAVTEAYPRAFAAYTLKNARDAIVFWQFNSPDVMVSWERDGILMEGFMRNPAKEKDATL